MWKWHLGNGMRTAGSWLLNDTNRENRIHFKPGKSKLPLLLSLPLHLPSLPWPHSSLTDKHRPLLPARHLGVPPPWSRPIPLAIQPLPPHDLLKSKFVHSKCIFDDLLCAIVLMIPSWICRILYLMVSESLGGNIPVNKESQGRDIPGCQVCREEASRGDLRVVPVSSLWIFTSM